MKKKSGIKGLIIAIVLILLIVGYYYYLSHRDVDKTDEVEISEVQNLLLRDLDRNYPPSPREVLKYFLEITTCLYNDKLSKEDAEALAKRAEELFDEELIANNPQEEYLEQLQGEILAFQTGKGRILNHSTSSSVDVDYFEENGHSFARLYGSYYMQVQKELKTLEEVFVLRKDENGHWKLYGWQPVEN